MGCESSLESLNDAVGSWRTPSASAASLGPTRIVNVEARAALLPCELRALSWPPIRLEPYRSHGPGQAYSSAGIRIPEIHRFTCYEPGISSDLCVSAILGTGKRR